MRTGLCGRSAKETALCTAIALAGTAALFGTAARAATDTWNGSSSANWADPANWSTAPNTPAPGDTLDFTGTAPATLNNNLSSGPFSIIFDAATTANLDLTGSSITVYGDITNSSTILQSVDLGLTLGSLSPTSNVGFHNLVGGTSGCLALNPTGGLQVNTGAVAAFAGTVTTTTITNDSTGILGAWATYGGDWAAVNSGVISAYTNYSNISGAPSIATLPGLNVKWSTSSGNATLALASGITDMNTLLFSDTSNRTITMNANQTLRLGADGGIFHSDATAAGNLAIGNSTNVGKLTAGGATNVPGELILNANGNTASSNGMVINAQIVDNGSGKLTLVKTGLAAAQIAGNSTYTGDTYIDQGRLREQTVGGFGTGNVYVEAGAEAYINGAGNSTNNFFLQGNGFNEGFFSGALRLATNSIIINGNITLLGDATITSRGATAAGATINGQITGAHNIEFNGAAAAEILNLTNTSNNWTGNTQLSFGTVKLSATSEVIPNGPGKGNLIFNGDPGTGNFSILDLDGHNETVNAVNSAGNTVNGIVQNSLAASTSTFTLGDNNASGNFGGSIQNGTGNVALTKIGSGTQTLSGSANIYTGVTTIMAGTLAITSATSNSNIVNTTKILVGDSVADNSAILNVTGITASGGFMMNSGQTLAGFGTIDGQTTLKSGAILAPGNSIGTLTFDGSSAAAPILSLASGAILNFDLNNTLLSDQLALINGAAGDIAFAGDTINFNDLSAGALTGGSYTLFSSDAPNAYSGLTVDGGGNITAGLTIGSGLSAYPGASLQVAGNNIVLNISSTPEPASLTLIGLGAAGLLVRRRK